MITDHDPPLTMWAMLQLLWLTTEPMDVGYMCEQRDCCSIARWLVTWPGQAPGRQCQHHYDWTLHIADTFGMRATIELAARPLAVATINVEPEDPTSARFAAMELT